MGSCWRIELAALAPSTYLPRWARQSPRAIFNLRHDPARASALSRTSSAVLYSLDLEGEDSLSLKYYEILGDY